MSRRKIPRILAGQEDVSKKTSLPNNLPSRDYNDDIVCEARLVELIKSISQHANTYPPTIVASTNNNSIKLNHNTILENKNSRELKLCFYAFTKCFTEEVFALRMMIEIALYGSSDSSHFIVEIPKLSTWAELTKMAGKRMFSSFLGKRQSNSLQNSPSHCQVHVTQRDFLYTQKKNLSKLDDRRRMQIFSQILWQEHRVRRKLGISHSYLCLDSLILKTNQDDDPKRFVLEEICQKGGGKTPETVTECGIMGGVTFRHCESFESGAEIIPDAPPTVMVKLLNWSILEDTEIIEAISRIRLVEKSQPSRFFNRTFSNFNSDVLEFLTSIKNPSSIILKRMDPVHPRCLFYGESNASEGSWGLLFLWLQIISENDFSTGFTFHEHATRLISENFEFSVYVYKLVQESTMPLYLEPSLLFLAWISFFVKSAFVESFLMFVSYLELQKETERLFLSKWYESNNPLLNSALFDSESSRPDIVSLFGDLKNTFYTELVELFGEETRKDAMMICWKLLLDSVGLTVKPLTFRDNKEGSNKPTPHVLLYLQEHFEKFKIPFRYFEYNSSTQNLVNESSLKSMSISSFLKKTTLGKGIANVSLHAKNSIYSSGKQNYVEMLGDVSRLGVTSRFTHLGINYLVPVLKKLPETDWFRDRNQTNSIAIFSNTGIFSSIKVEKPFFIEMIDAFAQSAEQAEDVMDVDQS